MSVNVEKMEKNLAKLTITIPAAEINAAEDRVYMQQKNKIQIAGFRKGKASRKMIEKAYGRIFFEDAVNEVLPEAYDKAVSESELEVVSMPEITYDQIIPGQDVIFTATVAVKPEVTLGQYKGLEVEAEVVEITEEDMAAELKKIQEQNSTEVTVEDRPVADGDKIKLDFEGSVDGVPFEGGKGEDYDLVIGSGSFIPGFEEQLVGCAIGEEKIVSVTFPETYHAEELAGKAAEFKCVVKAITAKVLPELNDEFASMVSEYETLEEYKNSVRTQLIDRKEAEAKTAKEDALVAKVVEGAEMDIPELMIKSTAEDMVREFEQRLQYQGMNLDMFCQYTGQTRAQMVEEYKDQAKKRIETRLVLEAVAAAEQIEVSEDDLEAEFQKMADQYGMTAEQVKGYLGAEAETMKKDLAVQKAVDLIYSEAK